MNPRHVLRERIADVVGPVYVPLSGGVDSTTVLLAALDVRDDVVAGSVHVDDVYSRDFRDARKNASTLGVPFREVVLPSDPISITEDLDYLIALGVRGKANIECTWPFLYILRDAKACRTGTMVTGSAADGNYGVSKKAMIHHRYPVEEFDRFRRDYFGKEDRAQTVTVSRLARLFEIEAIAPWRDPVIVEGFLGRTWDEMNKPRQKEPTRQAFPELDGLRIKPHTNLQLGDSEIASTFGGTALAVHGKPGDKSPVSVYNRLARQHDGHRILDRD